MNPSRSPVYSDIFNYLLKTFCLVLLNFRFQKCRDPNPRLDPVGESKPEPGLLRHFQLYSQNILFVLFHFRLFNYAEALHYGQAHKYLQNNAFISTYTHAIHFRMLSFYKSFIQSQHALNAYYINKYSCYSILHAFILQIIYPITTCIECLLYQQILMLFNSACFHFTSHLSYHNMHFQCDNSIHHSIYEI